MRHIFFVEHEEMEEEEMEKEEMEKEGGGGGCHHLQGWQYSHIHVVLDIYKSPAVLKMLPRNTCLPCPKTLRPSPPPNRWSFLKSPHIHALCCLKTYIQY